MTRGVNKFTDQRRLNPVNNGIALPPKEAAQRQRNEMIQLEINATAVHIFANLVANHAGVFNEVQTDPRVIPNLLRHCAAVATKSAPYLYELRGVVSIDDEKTWGGAVVVNEPSEEAKTATEIKWGAQ